MGDRRSDGRKVLGQDHRSPVSLPNAQRQSVAVDLRIMCRRYHSASRQNAVISTWPMTGQRENHAIPAVE